MNVTRAGLPRGLGRGAGLALALGWLVLMAALATAVVQVDLERQARSLDRQLDDAKRRLDARLARDAALMGALVSLHTLATGELESPLAAFAATTGDRLSEHVRLGRLDDIAFDERAAYERRMTGRGRYRFRVEDRANPVAGVGDRSRRLPIAAIEPLTPILVGLLGQDLGNLSGFGDRFDHALRTGRPFLHAIPDDWPIREALLLVQPSYRGQRIPEREAARFAQRDGAYFAVLELAALADTVREHLDRVPFRLVVDDAVGNRSPQGARRIGPFESSEADPVSRVVRRDSTIGLSRLSIEADAAFAPSIDAMALGAVLAAVATLIYLMLAVLEHGRRVRRHDRATSERAILSEREYALRTLDALDDAIVTLDGSRRIRSLNATALAWFDERAAGAIDRSIDDLASLVAADDRDTTVSLDRALATLVDGAVTRRSVSRTERVDEVLDVSLSRLINEAGCTTYFVVLRDVSVEHRLTHELRFRAHHDPLTGCANRFRFEQCLDALVDPDTDGCHALVCIDLDRFKAVNDACGHPTGDRLLIEIVTALNDFATADDTVARLGGDEFAILLAHVDADTAVQRASALHAFFTAFRFNADQRSFNVSASIGLVTFEAGNCDASRVLARADAACYRAKHGGRDALVVCDGSDRSGSADPDVWRRAA